jgi:hypothetical protein
MVRIRRSMEEWKDENEEESEICELWTATATEQPFVGGVRSTRLPEK